MLRIDDLLIFWNSPQGLVQKDGATPHRVGELNPRTQSPIKPVVFGRVGRSLAGRRVYCNQPRLRKYHMGTMALASINAKANG